MNVSPAYAKEYREWMENGQWEFVYRNAVHGLPQALKRQHPALIAGHLESIATVYHTRGAVKLLNGEADDGWRDIQCGYWAALYAVEFEWKAVTLPAWACGRRFSVDHKVEAVMTIGLAKLFQQGSDIPRLEALIGTPADIEEMLGDKVESGETILRAILEPDDSVSFVDLLNDRKECCKKFMAWPKRPTAIRPFGVVDVEAMLLFPEKASFHYSLSAGFDPVEDPHLIEAVSAFHCWYG